MNKNQANQLVLSFQTDYIFIGGLHSKILACAFRGFTVIQHHTGGSVSYHRPAGGETED